MPDVVIIGGGISGLAAAWELQQHGVSYTLLEASARLGGKVVTEYTDGFILEAGADSFLTTKPWAWQLCREIGFADQLIETNPDKRAVYVYRAGRLHLYPRGMRLIVPLDTDAFLETELLSEAGKQRMLAETLVPPRRDLADESLADFVRRRFGDEALAVFGDSLLSGIHVADPEVLSIAATFPDYPRLEREYGSVIRGMHLAPPPQSSTPMPKSAFVSPRAGMDALVQAISAKLTGEIRLNTSVSCVNAKGSLLLEGGERLFSKGILITTPSSIASCLVEPISAELSARLSAFKFNSSGTVSLGFRAADLEHPLEGYGFVVPRSEPTQITACTWSSSKLAGRAPEGYALLRVFVGGAGREADLALSDADLIRLARAELQAILGIQAEPVIVRVYRWRSASPQYEVGHLDRVAEIKGLCPPWLALAGCGYEGVGVPDCVRQGRAAARQIMENL